MYDDTLPVVSEDMRRDRFLTNPAIVIINKLKLFCKDCSHFIVLETPYSIEGYTRHVQKCNQLAAQASFYIRAKADPRSRRDLSRRGRGGGVSANISAASIQDSALHWHSSTFTYPNTLSRHPDPLHPRSEYPHSHPNNSSLGHHYNIVNQPNYSQIGCPYLNETYCPTDGLQGTFMPQFFGFVPLRPPQAPPYAPTNGTSSLSATAPDYDGTIQTAAAVKALTTPVATSCAAPPKQPTPVALPPQTEKVILPSINSWFPSRIDSGRTTSSTCITDPSTVCKSHLPACLSKHSLDSAN
ncbi:hypothetical protein JR316_0000052 [Psilocybe cubensis]|uniref:Uncharacterized protein n=2 Tax=Psilocybe cubensis TaxID=181762 RepID=A0ACB8HFR4_PSICU|nr:hypothetical protein JR316_0000052 [Psilocybe cubensis]KAH9485990.1 hypothetical protein JR316_0000052 [Psilocybe cubensis]